jgi:hypothetical protein
MATSWKLTFEGEPTDEDREQVAWAVAEGFTSGQLVSEPGPHPFASAAHDPANCPGCTLRIAGILGDLKDYEAAHSDPAGEATYNIWDDLIVRLPEYEVDTTEVVDGGSHMHFAALGTVFSYSHDTGGWVSRPYGSRS